MNEETYSFTKEQEIFYYEFFSEGPMGRIGFTAGGWQPYERGKNFGAILIVRK